MFSGKDSMLSTIVVLGLVLVFFFFFQAEDGIRDVLGSRGLGMCIRDRTTRVSNPQSSE